MNETCNISNCFENKIVDYMNFQRISGYWRYIYDRKMLIDNGILFPSYRRFQDPPFFIRAMYAAKKFYAIDKIVVVYRMAIKPYKYSEQATLDYAKGILDVIEYTGKNELKISFLLANKILKNEGEAIISQYILTDNEELELVCDRISDCLNKYNSFNVEGYNLDVQEMKIKMRGAIKKKEELIKTISQHDSVYIYGAGSFARTLYTCLIDENISNLEAFVISNKVIEDAKIERIPVISITDLDEKKLDILIIIATQNKFHEEIQETLMEKGCENIICIDQKDIIMYS